MVVIVDLNLRDWAVTQIDLLAHCFLLEVRCFYLLFFLLLLSNFYGWLRPIKLITILLYFLLLSLRSQPFYCTFFFFSTLSFPWLLDFVLIKLPLFPNNFILLLIQAKQLTLILNKLICKTISGIELPSSIYKEHSIPFFLLNIPHDKIFYNLWRGNTILLNSWNVQPSHVNC